MIFTSVELLSSIKSRGMIPNSQNTFDDDSLLNLSNEELQRPIVQLLLRVHEEYLVWTDSIPLESNVSRYRIPERAIGQKLRDITLVDGSTETPLNRINREDAPLYLEQSSSRPLGFYLEGNRIILVPNVGSTSLSLNVSYFMRPGKIVDSTRWRQITALDTANKTITMSSIPSNFTAGSKVDVIQHLSGNELLIKDLTITNVDSANMRITVDGGISEAKVSNYICTAKESAVPQCPEELHPMLAQMVVCRVMESLNDSQGLANAQRELLKMQDEILPIIDSRIEGKPQKIINRNGFLAGMRGSNVRYVR